MELDAINEWRDQMGNLVRSALGEIRGKLREANEGPGALESLRAFAAAVDWKEPWILALLAGQALLFASAVGLRAWPRAQLAIFVASAGVVYSAERLNALGARHWRAFAAQPYFDPDGIFFSALVSAPLLATMVVVVVAHILAAMRDLVAMKRHELRRRARALAAAETAERAAAEGSPSGGPVDGAPKAGRAGRPARGARATPGRATQRSKKEA